MASLSACKLASNHHTLSYHFFVWFSKELAREKQKNGHGCCPYRLFYIIRAQTIFAPFCFACDRAYC